MLPDIYIRRTGDDASKGALDEWYGNWQSIPTDRPTVSYPPSQGRGVLELSKSYKLSTQASKCCIYFGNLVALAVTAYFRVDKLTVVIED